MTTYNQVGTSKTFDEAKKLISPGCHMLSKEISTDRDAVLKKLDELDGSTVWVDASRDDSGKFLWGDGTPMTLGPEEFWSPGEPNNSRGAEDVVELYSRNADKGRGKYVGMLNDIRDNRRNTVLEACPARRWCDEDTTEWRNGMCRSTINLETACTDQSLTYDPSSGKCVLKPGICGALSMDPTTGQCVVNESVCNHSGGIVRNGICVSRGRVTTERKDSSSGECTVDPMTMCGTKTTYNVETEQCEGNGGCMIM